MKRGGPLKRRVSLRDSQIRKIKDGGTVKFWTNSGKLVTRKPLKKISKSQRNRLKKYLPIAKEFLALPENQMCAICIARREHGENIRINPATEVHHRFGRGPNLTDVRGFVASCFSCRTWPHENPRLAREWGLLCPAPQWMVSIPK